MVKGLRLIVSVAHDVTGLRSRRPARFDQPPNTMGRMQLTEVLQALRPMKPEDIYDRWQARRLSQGYAAATVPPKRFSRRIPAAGSLALDHGLVTLRIGWSRVASEPAAGSSGLGARAAYWGNFGEGRGISRR
jgi:hypothetical protein